MKQIPALSTEKIYYQYGMWDDETRELVEKNEQRRGKVLQDIVNLPVLLDNNSFDLTFYQELDNVGIKRQAET